MIESHDRLTPQEKARAATEDHKTPRNLGGSNDKDNLVISCSRCNVLKASIPYTVFKIFSDMVLRSYPDLPTPILRNVLNRYLMHLLDRAATDRKVMRNASTIAMLKLQDEIDKFEGH